MLTVTSLLSRVTREGLSLIGLIVVVATWFIPFQLTIPLIMPQTFGVIYLVPEGFLVLLMSYYWMSHKESVPFHSGRKTNPAG